MGRTIMAEANRGGQPARHWKRVVALAGALLLGACQTLVPRGPVEAPPQPTRPVAPPPVTGVETGIPRDVQRNRVALLVPLTGPNAGVGRSIANAVQLAQLDTRSEQVRITSYDTSVGAAAAAQRAVSEGAQLILGPLLADDVRQVVPVARAARVPVVAFSNDASLAGQGAYLMGYAPTQSIERVVEYARSRGVTNFAGLIPNGVYGQRASTAFLRSVEGVGGKVIALQTYDRTGGAVAGAVARLAKDAPYQGILIADGGATANAASGLARKTSPAAHVLGTELWNSESSLPTRTNLAGAWFASVPDALYRQYATKYRARFAAAPYRLSSLGYDAVLLTVRIARDWPVGQPFPEERLRDRGGFAGIDGAFRFGRDGIAERALEVQEVRPTGVVTVSPAPTGFDAR